MTNQEPSSFLCNKWSYKPLQILFKTIKTSVHPATENARHAP